MLWAMLLGNLRPFNKANAAEKHTVYVSFVANLVLHVMENLLVLASFSMML